MLTIYPILLSQFFEKANVAHGARKYLPLLGGSPHCRPLRDDDTMSYIVNRSADGQLAHPTIPAYLSNGSFRFSTALHIAAFNGNVGIAKLLIENGADINATMACGDTPLMVSVLHHRKDLIVFLLERSADVNAVNYDYNTALTFAIRTGDEDVMRMLESHGAELSASNWFGENLLRISVQGANLGIFHHLRERGFDPRETDVHGTSIAHFAFQVPGFCSYLLNTDRTLNFTQSPINIFSWAAHHNNVSLIRLLYHTLGHHFSLKSLEDYKIGHSSPICAAAKSGHIRSVDLLLRLGVDMEREGCEEGTALMAAGAFGRLGVVKILVRVGASIEYTNRVGKHRSLFRAASSHPNVVRWMILEQFMDQPRLHDRHVHIGNAEEVKYWAGIISVEYDLEPRYRRGWGVAWLDYLIWLKDYKTWLQGRVIDTR